MENAVDQLVISSGANGDGDDEETGLAKEDDGMLVLAALLPFHKF